jgi:transcriptional regulator with XRE-family HTH domain
MAESRSRRAQDIDLAVGRRLRERRVLLGLTLRRLAEPLGIAYQQLAKYERGANRLSAGRLYRIAQALGVEVGYFFEDVDPEGRDRAGLMAARSQERRLLELARHVVAICDPRQRAAVCQLARELAALGRRRVV